MPRVFFNEDSKTGLCFGIEQRQQKCWHKLTLQSLVNPAVDTWIDSMLHLIDKMMPALCISKIPLVWRIFLENFVLYVLSCFRVYLHTL